MNATRVGAAAFPGPVTAVILAGGFGTRIQHLLLGVPKPMAPVAGKPFLEWTARYLARQGVGQICISTGHLAGVIQDHFQSQPIQGATVRCMAETRPLGTAGGFLNAVKACDTHPGGWLVLNGDSLTLTSLAGLTGSLRETGIGGAILGVRMPEASRYGTLEQNERGELTAFREKRPGSGVVNAGVYLFRDALLASFPSPRPLSFETDVFPALQSGGIQLKVCVTDAPFLDIGTPESLPLAESFIREHADWF